MKTRLDLSGLERPTIASFSGAAPRAPLDRFQEDPENPRTEFGDDDFEALVEDIKQRGVLQPLVVQAIDGGMFQVRFGARRLRAAKRLELQDVPYVITEDDRQLDGYAQVSENEQRKNLEPLELARFVAKRLADGEQKSAVAKKLGLGNSAISFLLSLIDSPPFISELYASGKCRVARTLYQLRKLHALNAAVVESRCASVSEITRSFVDGLTVEIDPPPERKPPADTVVVGPDKHDAKSALTSANAPAVLKVQPSEFQAHNPNLEKLRPAAQDPTRLRRPLLLGKHLGRDVMVMLALRPSSPGLVFVRYEDNGADAEVSCGEIAISQLTEATS